MPTEEREKYKLQLLTQNVFWNYATQATNLVFFGICIKAFNCQETCIIPDYSFKLKVINHSCVEKTTYPVLFACGKASNLEFRRPMFWTRTSAIVERGDPVWTISIIRNIMSASLSLRVDIKCAPAKLILKYWFLDRNRNKCYLFWIIQKGCGFGHLIHECLLH